MKIYIENISVINKEHIEETHTFYLTNSGIYKINKNKIIKYGITETDKSKKIPNYINNKTAYVSYDTLTYVCVSNYIPDIHFKLKCKKKIFKIDKHITYIEELINGVVHNYFETNMGIDSVYLKTHIKDNLKITE
jgi:hypothetical protein